jgi:hypothetical protein
VARIPYASIVDVQETDHGEFRERLLTVRSSASGEEVTVTGWCDATAGEDVTATIRQMLAKRTG